MKLASESTRPQRRRAAPARRWARPALALGAGGALVLAFGGVAGATGAAGVARARPVRHHVVSIRVHGTAFHSSTSSNWSGYNEGALSTGTLFSSVSGDWTVPTATQHTAGQAEDSATWIGIGGGCLDTSCTAGDETLIQAGTEQDVAANGATSYSAWWELVPAPSVSSTITVKPGDRIHCTISSVLDGLWQISLSDLTNGQSFSETLPYPSSEDTAEWIVETPIVIGTSGTGEAALPNLGTVSFTGAMVNGANAHLTPADEIVLTDSNGKPIATPSAPGTDAASFNDCAWATTCATP